MELIFIISAFIAGFIALKCQLPPLVGFLVAGFILHAVGYDSNHLIISLADLGVTLLLFTIGLKLDIKVLLSKEIWFGASAHNLCSTLFFALALYVLKIIGFSSIADMTSSKIILLAFALSFSSTVFAVKSLQEKGEMNATYGTLAIGILVMQDIFAVIFMTASTGKLPEWYALGLFILPLLRPLFYKLLDWAGHGEMLVLFGISFALVMGAGLFGYVGMKPDLGALILGMLLAAHPKASELSKSLFNIKELFLVCFFLNIGLSSSLSITSFALAMVFILLLPIKGVLYYLIMSLFKFRVRTSLFTTIALFNFSEFGLIVGGLAFSMGWVSGDILAAIAISVSLSFIIASPLNRFSHEIYNYSEKWLKEHAAEKINQRDQFINPGESQVLILGMGRIGCGAYDELISHYGKICLGIEIREEAAIQHRKQGRNVIEGDATDPDFWQRILNTTHVKLVLLAMPHHLANQIALEQLQSRDYQGQIAAIAEYSDQLDSLIENGVDAAFNVYNEAGSGFAIRVCDQLKPEFTSQPIQ